VNCSMSEENSEIQPRRERRALDGVLLIDKPTEMSSAQVVGKIKWLLRCEKIGHAGTLDPGASGLLVCLLGRATRLAAHAESGVKTYSGTVELGLTTSTDDTSGEVLSRAAVAVTADQIAQVAARFVGTIEQFPPKISALKVGGKRAYALARQGIDVELKPRPVTVLSCGSRMYNQRVLTSSVYAPKARIYGRSPAISGGISGVGGL